MTDNYNVQVRQERTDNILDSCQHATSMRDITSRIGAISIALIVGTGVPIVCVNKTILYLLLFFLVLLIYIYII